MTDPRPPARLLDAIRRSRSQATSTPRDGRQTAEAARELLRRYRQLASDGHLPDAVWRSSAKASLTHLGGDADRLGESLRDYDHHRYGPFLGVSDDGDAADDICRAAWASPKAKALGSQAAPMTIGVAVDGERLGGVGEVVVGPAEYTDIWSKCAGRALTTTNVGARANVRNFFGPPLVPIAEGAASAALKGAQEQLAAALKPVLVTPNKKPLPVLVFVEFGSRRRPAERKAMLRALVQYVRSGSIAAPKVHRLGFNVRIGWGPRGRDAAIQAVDLARSVGITTVSIDGVVRKEADRAISMSGLLNYLAPGLVAQLQRHADRKGVEVRPLMQVDPDTVARSTWSALSVPRALNFYLGKYGLVPLTLEESVAVVRQVQPWFPDWSSAPVCYVDQGVITRNKIYVGRDLARGIEVWLRTMAKLHVKVVLIDTVDKGKGWKILKTDGDPKGLLGAQQIGRLAKLGESLGIKVLWAGGITGPQAYEFGRLGVFGIYVTTAASITVPVEGKYRRDPALAARKRPTFEGVASVKTLVEAGYLGERAGLPGDAAHASDLGLMAKALPGAWRRWWRTAGKQAAGRR